MKPFKRFMTQRINQAASIRWDAFIPCVLSNSMYVYLIEAIKELS